MKNSSEGAVEREKHFEMVKEYYKDHGYDPEYGIPTRKTLEDLDLKYVADEIEKNFPYKKWDGPLLRPLDAYPVTGKRI